MENQHLNDSLTSTLVNPRAVVEHKMRRDAEQKLTTQQQQQQQQQQLQQQQQSGDRKEQTSPVNVPASGAGNGGDDGPSAPTAGTGRRHNVSQPLTTTNTSSISASSLQEFPRYTEMPYGTGARDQRPTGSRGAAGTGDLGDMSNVFAGDLDGDEESINDEDHLAQTLEGINIMLENAWASKRELTTKCREMIEQSTSTTAPDAGDAVADPPQLTAMYRDISRLEEQISRLLGQQSIILTHMQDSTHNAAASFAPTSAGTGSGSGQRSQRAPSPQPQAQHSHARTQPRGEHGQTYGYGGSTYLPTLEQVVDEAEEEEESMGAYTRPHHPTPPTGHSYAPTHQYPSEQLKSQRSDGAVSGSAAHQPYTSSGSQEDGISPFPVPTTQPLPASAASPGVSQGRRNSIVSVGMEDTLDGLFNRHYEQLHEVFMSTYRKMTEYKQHNGKLQQQLSAANHTIATTDKEVRAHAPALSQAIHRVLSQTSAHTRSSCSEQLTHMHTAAQHLAASDEMSVNQIVATQRSVLLALAQTHTHTHAHVRQLTDEVAGLRRELERQRRIVARVQDALTSEDDL